MPTSRVAVVGAGPAGGALAYLLARRGIDVTLIERQSDFARAFRGEGLTPGGIDVFHQMGLRAAFDRLPHVVFDALELYRTRRLLVRVALDGFGPRWVSQPAMLEMLVDEASRFPTFRCLRGARVDALIRDGRRVTGVRCVSPDGPSEVMADYVVATDGRDSTVRQRAGLALRESPQRFDVVWCKVPVPTEIGGRGPLRVFVGDRHFALVIPSYDERLQIGWIIEKGSFGDLYRRGIDEWLTELADHLTPDLGDHLRSHRAAVSHPFLLNVVCGALERWTEPGLLLIGDAAHPMSPVGAQGINLALRDAVVAANHLGPALAAHASTDALDVAAASVMAERLGEITEIQRIQQVPPRLIFAGGWRTAVVLNAVALLVKTGLIRIVAAPLARRLGQGVATVRLEG